MELSSKGKEFIKNNEGLRLKKYKDVAGYDTIGYGHLCLPAENMPDVISKEFADALFEKDCKPKEQAVTNLVKVVLSQNEFDSLVDFAFNLGSGALASSTLLKHLNAGNKKAAAEEFLKWNKAGGKEVFGLTVRRKADRRVFLTGEYNETKS